MSLPSWKASLTLAPSPSLILANLGVALPPPTYVILTPLHRLSLLTSLAPLEVYSNRTVPPLQARDCPRKLVATAMAAGLHPQGWDRRGKFHTSSSLNNFNNPLVGFTNKFPDGRYAMNRAGSCWRCKDMRRCTGAGRSTEGIVVDKGFGKSAFRATTLPFSPLHERLTSRYNRHCTPR